MLSHLWVLCSQLWNIYNLANKLFLNSMQIDLKHKYGEIQRLLKVLIHKYFYLAPFSYNFKTSRVTKFWHLCCQVE